MNLNTVPTKGNLMSAKSSLTLAKQGFELMDKKRNILIREIMDLNEKAKGIQTPQWDIDDVKTWQKTELENAKIKGQTNDFPNRDVKNDAVFETELKIIKGYGKAIKAVKEVGNDAQKKLKEAANNCSKNANGVSYAKIGNAISSVTKEAVSLIMERVNAAAKAVTASLKKEKPAKEDKKAKEQPKADDKKTATGESASFLDSLDFI